MTSSQDKKILYELAVATINNAAEGNHESNEISFDSESLMTIQGSFVTLYKNGQLRGCIGDMSYTKELWKSVVHSAYMASTSDTRFSPVTSDEIPELEIEISLLSPLREISGYTEYDHDKDGIVIELNGRCGVFLPKVAHDRGWDRDTTLNHLCQKAGMSVDSWKNAEMKYWVYDAEVFGKDG